MATEKCFFGRMMSEETDVETLSLLAPIEDFETQPTVAKTVIKRSSNYTNAEDIQLCKSWESISTDPIIGNKQPGRAYWKRIADHYHANKTFESDRNPNSLEHRWSIIHRECSKFQGFYEEVERRHPSGIPYKEHLLEAQTLYSNKDPKNKSFQFVHCWLKVRNCQKFQTVENNKRPRSKRSSKEGGEEEDNISKSVTQNSDASQPNPKRPIGRKQAKEKLKSGEEAGPYKEVMQGLIMEKEDRKLKEGRWKETKALEEAKLAHEKEKLMWEQEQKIMFCDVSILEPDVRTYVLTMRAQIAASKMGA